MLRVPSLLKLFFRNVRVALITHEELPLGLYALLNYESWIVPGLGKLGSQEVFHRAPAEDAVVGALG
ncbi:hypothetical protein D3C81_2239830 [compost metagenome]